MGNRRSPYLILGVPYGASKNDAARAFARATRRLRRQSDAPYDLDYRGVVATGTPEDVAKVRAQQSNDQEATS